MYVVKVDIYIVFLLMLYVLELLIYGCLWWRVMFVRDGDLVIIKYLWIVVILFSKVLCFNVWWRDFVIFYVGL